MNKNKKIVKAMSGVLCASMLMGSAMPVFATDTQTTSKETDIKKVEVTYNKSASYQVTIPKVITLDSNKTSKYSVKVSGDIPSDKNVYVAPQDAISQTDEIDFYMKDQSTKNAKEDVVATVTQNKDTWDFEDVANGVEETNNTISATSLTAGNWKGTFNFNINLKDVEAYGSNVTLTSGNFSTYGIVTEGDVVIPSVVTDSNGVKHKVTSIGLNAFRDCDKLTSVIIPNSVTSIGSGAFYGCSGLTSITIPNSVTSIESSAFRKCTGLTSITIPESVTSIGGSAFSECTGLSSIVVDKNNPKYDSRNNCNAIIETNSNKLISGCKTTNTPKSVTSIGDCAFSGCTGLTSIEIPYVTSIGYSAFYGCSGLSYIYIPDSVTSIGESAFWECSRLPSINIPNNITSIGGYAFGYCKNLKAITYKGQTYTNQTQLQNKLMECGVGLTKNPFEGTALQ